MMNVMNFAFGKLLCETNDSDVARWETPDGITHFSETLHGMA